MEMNKKGYTTIALFFVVIMGLALLLGLGVWIYAFDLFDESASQITGDLGNVSFNGTYQQIMQPAIISAKTTFPKIISIGVLLGVVICMLIIGFNVKRLGPLWMLLDFGIIIAAEVMAVTVRSSFITFMNSSPEFLEIFRTDLAFGAKFILNIHLLTAVIGGLIMIATYFVTREKEEDSNESFG